MAHYDQPGVSYDSGIFYDEAEPPTPPTPKPKRRMASLKLNLSRLTPAQVVAQAKLSGNALKPASPATPPIAEVGTEATAMLASATTADAAIVAYEAAKAALVTLKQTRDDAVDQLRMDTTACGAAVSAKAKGDPAILALSLFPLAQDPGAPQPAGSIANFTVTAGDMDGSLDYSWDPKSGSKSYELQITTVDPVAGPYVTKAQPTGSSATVSGLTSGARVWGRVRGIGSVAPNTGPWTDPATKIVP